MVLTESHVLRDVLLGVVAVGDKERDQNHVVALEELGEVVDLGIFVHVERLHLVEAVALGDPVGVVLDRFRRVLVALGTVADDGEPEPSPTSGCR